MLLPFQVTKNITLLGSEYFNLYLVRGETNAIIEGGVSAVAYPFLNQLNQLDVSPESISHLVILHSHFDHMMVFPLLKNRYPWMKIVSSVLNRAIFLNERIMGKIFDSDRTMTLTLMEEGLISEAPTLTPSASFPLDIALEEGSILDLGKGATIRFIEAPGHAPAASVLIWKKKRLFSALMQRVSTRLLISSGPITGTVSMRQKNPWIR